jgi:hypothetical protein
MAQVAAFAFLSPTLVLLAIDREDGAKRNDFLDFAVKRTSGSGRSKVTNQKISIGCRTEPLRVSRPQGAKVAYLRTDAAAGRL